MNKKLSVAKGFKTKSKTLRQRAKTLREKAKGDYSLSGDRLRRQAKELVTQAKTLETRAKEIRREVRAAKKGITPGEQAILDRLQTEKARAARKKAKPIEIPDFDESYIDTVEALVTSGRSGTTLSTPVALAVKEWMTRAQAEIGTRGLAMVCENALTNHPYIFDSYIYSSDQAGILTNETLGVLNRYAEIFYSYSEEQDETRDNPDQDDGTGEMYF